MQTESFRIRKDLLDRLRVIAAAERRPLTTQVEIVVEEWLGALAHQPSGIAR